MSQAINTNIASLNAQRNLAATSTLLTTSVQRLSSGLRVNSAKDDAAGLAIAERMSSQIRGMRVAIRNANDAISMSQTADGALGKLSDALQRMRELAVQSANATNGSDDRAALQLEFDQLQKELTRIVKGTEFNGISLFASTETEPLRFQVGAGTEDGIDTVEFERSKLDGGVPEESGQLPDSAAMDVALATVLEKSVIGASAGVDGNGDPVMVPHDGDDAKNAIADIDVLLDRVNSERAKFGAAQNRFEAIISFLNTAVQNQEASRGRIVDADYATETSNLTRAQILQQAGTAMLAQANQVPTGVLKLLQ